MNNHHSTTDTGLTALVLAARILGVAADPQQLSHQLGGKKMGVPELLRSAKKLKLKAKPVKSDWKRLSKTTPPCIACYKDGSFIIIGRITTDSVFVQDPVTNRPKSITTPTYTRSRTRINRWGRSFYGRR